MGCEFGRCSRDEGQRGHWQLTQNFCVCPGAEYLCAYTYMILQKLGYRVNLVSDDYDPPRVQALS